MKHNSIQTKSRFFNLVKVGGNFHFNEVDTNSDFYIDERKEFIELVKTHGYDILVPGDFLFSEKEDEYNRVLELQAKYVNLDTYERWKFSELCVCGAWLFTRTEYVINKEITSIKDKRGGRREGAGRKSNSKLISMRTAVIRVPYFQKEKIKDFIAWIIEKEANDNFLSKAIFHAKLHCKDEAKKYDECGMTEEAKKARKEADLLDELYYKLPLFTYKKE